MGATADGKSPVCRVAESASSGIALVDFGGDSQQVSLAIKEARA